MTSNGFAFWPHTQCEGWFHNVRHTYWVAEKDTLNQIGLYKMLVEQLNQWTLNFNQENEIVFLVALSGFTILQEQGSINQVLSNKYFLKWI